MSASSNVAVVGGGPNRRRSGLGQSMRRYTEVRKEHVAPFFKFSLFVTNTIAWLISCGLIAVGIYSRAASSNFWDLSGFATDPSVLLIAVGCLFFVVGLCGAIGSLRENITALKIFHYMLIVLLLVEVITGVVLYVLQAKVQDLAITATVRAISQYQTTNKATALDDAIREVQIRFQCCGARHPSDWRVHSRYFECTQGVFQELVSSCGVPPSCCREGASLNAQCGYKVFAYANMTTAEQAMYPRIAKRGAIIWSGGCVEAVFVWIKSNWLVLGILCGVVVLIQFCGIEFSRRLIDQIWYLQTQL